MQDPLSPGIQELEHFLNLQLHPSIAKMLQEDGGNPAVADTRQFITEANRRCAEVPSPADDLNVGAVQQLFVHLAMEEVVADSPDGNARLIRLRHVVTGDSYPHLWHLFFIVPGDKGHGLDNENHGSGYHIHYVDTRKPTTRTNAVFTFNPSEPMAPTPTNALDTLYWYRHSGKISVDPDTFSTKRKQTIYSTCVGFLASIVKTAYITPPRTAHRLWP